MRNKTKPVTFPLMVRCQAELAIIAINEKTPCYNEQKNQLPAQRQDKIQVVYKKNTAKQKFKRFSSTCKIISSGSGMYIKVLYVYQNPGFQNKLYVHICHMYLHINCNI